MPEVIEHPGIKHRTIQNADGTWNILDVPILPPIPKGAKFNSEDIGAEWMRAAIQVAERDLVSGHLGSLSVGHHPEVSIGIKPEYAGKILPRRVGTAMLEGREVPCLYADYLFVPNHIKDRIKAHELSYRSPEVVNWAKFRIDNVSLLSTEPPYFRGPMSDIGEEVPFAPGMDGSFETPMQFASAHFSDQPLGSYSFSKEFQMPDPKKTKPAAKLEDGEEKKEKGGDMEGGEGMDLAAAVAVITKALKALDPILNKPEEGVAPEAPPAEMEEEEKTAGKPEPVQMKDTAGMARLTALESKIRHMEAEESRKALIAGAIADLEGEAIQLDDQDREDVAKFAAMGEPALNGLVAQLKRHASRDSAPSFDALVRRNGKADPPEVAKFTDPTERAEARKLSAEFDKLSARVSLQSTREQFIAANLKSSIRG